MYISKYFMCMFLCACVYGSLLQWIIGVMRLYSGSGRWHTYIYIYMCNIYLYTCVRVCTGVYCRGYWVCTIHGVRQVVYISIYMYV